ncbi:MAG: NAD(P)-dependent oxidoreductase, partial [Nitrososphaeraceae archaeon]
MIPSNMQAKRWLDRDVSMDALKNQTIAVIGYGIQGRAQASNMRDSGLNVLVGLRKGGNRWALAEKEGHHVTEIDDATKQAD